MPYLEPNNLSVTRRDALLRWSSGITCALALFVASARVYGQAPPPPVPAEYQNLASALQSNLSTFTRSMQSSWSGARSNVVYSAQLRTASSNESSTLLKPQHQARVDAELQALQALGVNAVTVHIDFPLLYAPYYANASEYEQYAQFYVQLAQEVRARGLKLIVETQLMKFSGPQLSYAQGLSWTNYQAGRAQTAVNVARLLNPDYMVVITEPDTELSFSRQAPVGTISGSVQMLTGILAALKQAGLSNVPVGAGVGTWMNSYNLWMSAYAALPVTFLDMHVYPTNRSFLSNALAIADIARHAGKSVTLSEAWLQKVSDSELSGNVMATDSRNCFGYWAPLDAEFLQAMVMMANYKQFAFISPFWTTYYFAYSSTTESDAEQQGAEANTVGAFTSTGLAYENALLPSPDKSAPQPPAAPAVTKSTHSIQLNWKADSDNVGVAGYNVLRDGTAIGRTYSTSYADTSAMQGTISYSISAFDAAGNASITSPPAQVRRP